MGVFSSTEFGDGLFYSKRSLEHSVGHCSQNNSLLDAILFK